MIGSDELLDELDGILQVYVVVPRPLRQQQAPLQIGALLSTEPSRYPSGSLIGFPM